VNPLRSVAGRAHPPRVEVVARELRRFRHPRYLEIGVNSGVVFLHVRAARKIAVDPEPRVPRWKWFGHPNSLLRGSLFRTTSDRFFAALDAEARFDVVFVDGDHRLEQSLRDTENALAHLSDDGVVLLHDCNPPTPAAASREPADAAGGPWCGDVWKTIVHLRASRADMAVETLDTDFGIGVVRGGGGETIELAADALPALTYEDLERDRERLLGLRPAPRPAR
jgi:hypothetical protein